MLRMGKTWSLFSSKSQTREEAGENVIWPITELCTKCYECFPGVLFKASPGAIFSRMGMNVEGHGIFSGMPGAQCTLQGLRGQRETDYEAPLSMLINLNLIHLSIKNHNFFNWNVTSPTLI